MDFIENGKSYEDNKKKEQKIRERIKQLWKRPEGTVAKISGILVLGALGWGLYKALPYLIALASNTILFVVELVVLAILLYVVTSKEFRRSIQLLWLQLNRKVMGWIVEMDPINILKNSIKEMEEKMKTVHKSVTDLEALLVNLKKKEQEYQEEFDKNKRDKSVVESKLKKPLPDEERDGLIVKRDLLSNDITLGAAQLKKQSERIKTSQKYLKIMKRLEKAAEIKIGKAQSKLKYTEEDYKQAKAQLSAMKSINSILNGGLTKSMEEEIALDQINGTINESIAEMNRLLDGSNAILVDYDISSESNSQLADEIIKAFDEKGFKIFESDPDDNKLGYASYEEVDDAEVVEGEKLPQTKRRSWI